MEEDEKPVTEPTPAMLIVGLNIVVLLVYTVFVKGRNDGGGIMLDAILIIIHTLICFGLASNKVSGKYWRLSALLVLVIGFSTCTNFFGMLHQQ